MIERKSPALSPPEVEIGTLGKSLRLTELPLRGAFTVEPQPHWDSRGFFARTFCSREFREQGLSDSFVQCSTSWNALAGTVRGLHYQLPPSCEVKLVRCTAGALLDVLVDMRPGSPSYLQHYAVELTAQNRLGIYIPEMFAHGYQTLEDGTEIFYQMSEFYAPGLAVGLRYDDPTLGIEWPLPVTSISDKDRSYALL